MPATATAVRKSIRQALLADGPLVLLLNGGDVLSRYTFRSVNIPANGATVTYYDTIARGGYMPSFEQRITFDVWARKLDLAEEVSARLQAILDSYDVTTLDPEGTPGFVPPTEIKLTSLVLLDERDDIAPDAPEIRRKTLTYVLRAWDLQ